MHEDAKDSTPQRNLDLFEAIPVTETTALEH